MAYYEKPYLKFHRVILSHLRAWPASLPTFLRTLPGWLQDRLVVPLLLKKELGFSGEVFFIKHHLSHAASAFLASPYDQAAILTADSVGEWATATWGQGRGSEITLRAEQRFPHSLGLLYTALTTYLGYEAHGGEGKVMGLAGLGEPRLVEQLRQVVHVLPDGSFRVDPRYLDVPAGRRMYSRRLVRLLGPPRAPGEEVSQRHRDVAASLQQLTEEILVAMARHVHAQTGLPRLCLAGGVFLNCVANARLLEQTPFEEIFVPPATGDCGGAVGAALYVHCALKGLPRQPQPELAYLGPAFSEEEIRTALVNRGLPFARLEEEALLRATVQLLEAQQVVGWFQGRMEIGPRALGNRSILADPRQAAMKDAVNARVKHREAFRPFAPAVLQEQAAAYFELRQPSPYMLLSPRVRPARRAEIPAVTHVDGSARVQTVSAQGNPLFYRLLQAFAASTGVPVLLNTSFNRNGEPIVCTPQDAAAAFAETEMDALVIGPFLVRR